MQPYSLGMTAIYLVTGKQPQEIEIDFRTGEFVWRQHALNVILSFATVIDKATAFTRSRFFGKGAPVFLFLAFINQVDTDELLVERASLPALVYCI